MFSKKEKSYSAALYESNEPTEMLLFRIDKKQNKTSNLNLYATDYKWVDI